MLQTLANAFALLFSTPLIPAAAGGVAWGILGGALPGISPSITMALVLPFTYGMDPGIAIVLLSATYVGAEYGGSIPAILINTPGTNAAAATVEAARAGLQAAQANHVKSDKDGRVSFAGVSAGSYKVRAHKFPVGGQPALVGEAEVALESGTQQELLLTLAPR